MAQLLRFDRTSDDVAPADATSGEYVTERLEHDVETY
jgi:hypothetical protein